VALIEISEPFRAGEQIPDWVSQFPSPGSAVVFAGYRQSSSNSANPELVQTKVGFLDQSRGCYMLRDECTQGFSGGPVTYQRFGQWLVAGMVVANLQHRPRRTWCLPPRTIHRALAALDIPMASSFLKQPSVNDAIEPCFRYLDDLRERHNPLRSFIDLGAKELFPQLEDVPSAAQKIVSIIDESSTSVQRVFFFGNYGSGKTCTAIEAAARALEACDPGLRHTKIPVYIELRDWKTLPSWTELARYIAESDRYPPSSVAEVLQLARSDRFFFLLDGLDELSGSLTVHGSVGLVQEIPRTLYDNASFVVFSRFSFLLEHDSLFEILEDSSYRLPYSLSESLRSARYRAYAMKPPSEPDIRAYLTEVCGDDSGFALRILEDVYDLADLARRPVLLSMIARCVPALKQEEQSFLQLGGSRIRSGDLYDVYITQWLRNPKHRSQLTHRQRRHILEDLAVYMWERRTLRIRHTELSDFLSSKLNANLIDELMYDIGNCSFLDLVADGYEFSHKSFLEFFVSSAICLDLFDVNHAKFTNELLVSQCMKVADSQNEVTDFIRDQAVRLAEANPDRLTVLTNYFSSPFREDRAHVGHLLGHLAKELKDVNLQGHLVQAFERETDPWAKRSLALACGRSGRSDVIRLYSEDLLPMPEHRLTNLRYHLQYYGTLRRVVEAVVSHVLSDRNVFLRPIDLFTLRQVMNAEPPMTPGDRWAAQALSELLGLDGTDDDLEEMIRCVGLRGVLTVLDRNS
jgi:hypothetical protein